MMQRKKLEERGGKICEREYKEERWKHTETKRILF